MPIKEFECADTSGCGNRFEKRFTTYDAYLKEINETGVYCPECSIFANPISSRTAPPQFKGTGFYTTDYK